MRTLLMNSSQPLSALAGSRRARWRPNWPAWRVCLSQQHQLQQLHIQIANELERDLVLLATEHKHFVAELEAALDTNPDAMIGEIAAAQLAYARETAANLWHAPISERAGTRRRLRTSAYPPDRLAVALYEAWQRAQKAAS